jgi:hypothetical protein
MKIKVGYLTYKVLEVPYIIEVTGTEIVNGEIDSENLVIQVRKVLLPSKKRQVLLHEIIHAISYNANLSLDENEVELLAGGLCGVLIDNLPLAKNMIKEIENEAIDNKAKK